MADKEVKKILIFAMPRTGTTIFQQIIANSLYKVANWNEPFNIKDHVVVKTEKIKTDPYQWLTTVNDGVFKLLAQNLDFINIDKLLEMGNFDLVVLPERKDLVECCLSLYWSAANNKYHYRTRSETVLTDFEADLGFVQTWCRLYHRYIEDKNIVISSKIPYNTIQYEEYMHDVPQTIGSHRIQRFSNVETFSFVPSNLPYRRMCRNVNAVEEIINKEIYAKRLRT